MNARPLRVLQVIPSIAASTGGPAHAVLGLSRALARRGVQVTLFTTDLAGAARGWGAPDRGGAPIATLARALRAEGIDTRAFPVLWPARYAHAPGLGRALRHAAPSFDLAHIHSLYLYPTEAASGACARAGVPYALRPHGTLTAFQSRKRTTAKGIYDRLSGSRAIAGAACIHYTSLQERREAEQGGVDRPGTVIPLGVEIAERASGPEAGTFRDRYPGVGHGPLVLFLGRLTPKKGLDLLLPAFAQARRTFLDAHLVIAGPDDEGYGETVRALIEENDLRGHVTLTGMLEGEAKRAALRDADLFVLPSYDENFGVAAAEAMGAGLPVIVSDQVDLHEAVAEAGAGTVIPCAIEPLADALERLLGDRRERAIMGERGHRLATQRYSWDGVAHQVIGMYREMIGRRDG